jgi:hypothetical protein
MATTINYKPVWSDILVERLRSGRGSAIQAAWISSKPPRPQSKAEKKMRLRNDPDKMCAASLDTMTSTKAAELISILRIEAS